jgi:monoamine oxidase
LWVSAAPPEFETGEYGNFKVVTAFVHNQHANSLSALGEEEAVNELLALLDRVFKRKGSNVASQVGLATKHFVKGGMMDWSQEPYIHGG